ncbi:hypothetical protein DL768_003314 [Monosporascus sp. mg162]|nr:hypothetical protein DL768_003314 [Monosporascus sp. mg162]
MPAISPSSVLYIVFTSGSTGAPKGATVTHANFCSAIRHHQPEPGFERSSRVSDYTSFHPSHTNRRTFLDPTTLNGLKEVLFIGEALKASDVAKWEASGAEIYNTYGLAECTVTSTVERVRKGEPDIRVGDPGIGKGTGALVWVVQARAPDRLAATGTIGKLWLEGPIVGASYLNNAEKTASDLVYYNPDGSLGFVGRNATQVKINGQRMELGEVEHHVRQLLPTKAVPQIVVDVITPDVTRSQTPAVFSVIPDGDSARVELNEVTVPMIANIRKELSKLLPSYMVPGVYIPIPLAKLPMTATGKTDRQKEEALRDIWTRLLDIKPDLIAGGHSFSEVGGDSIKTMPLAMAIRKQFDINTGVPRLVRQQNNLRELAALIDNLLHGQSVEELTQPTPTDLEIVLLVSKIDFGRTTTGSTVFLTGSTGFLGTHIFHYTLTKRAFDKVVLLVPGLDEQKGWTG